MSEGYHYDRVLLKLSGGAGGRRRLRHRSVVDDLADRIAEIVRAGVQMAVVVGGGNIFRGWPVRPGHGSRAQADYIGMLARDDERAVALQDVTSSATASSRACRRHQHAECPSLYPADAIRHMEKGRVVIFSRRHGNRTSPPTSPRRCAPAGWTWTC